MARRRFRIGIVVVLVVAAVVDGVAVVRRPPPDVVLIVADTLRADHLHCYGYARETSPTIDRLAARGTLFETCLTPIPRTTQSVASILTGREPFHHGVRYLNSRLPDTERTLAEILGRRGYRTIEVAASGFVAGTFDRGFQAVDGTPGEWPAAETTDRAIRALSRAPDGPVFLFVFYHDPHMPYAPPTRYFDADYQGRFRDAIDYAPSKGEMVYRNAMTPREREHAVALYDSEIRYMDGQIARLLAAVEARGRKRVVVFTADHGEALGENGVYFDHGDLLDDAALRVPLIVTGIRSGAARATRMARLIDVAPTILARLKVRAPGARFDGVDLAAGDPNGAAEPEAFAETGDALLIEAFETGRRAVDGIRGRPRAVTSGGWRAIWFPRADGVDRRLYDLTRDPLQRRDLYPRPDKEELFRRLAGRIALDRPEETTKSLSEDEARRLKALGYL